MIRQSKQRVFSHKDIYDYKDYLKLKSGELMLKNMKTKVKNRNQIQNSYLNRFNSYQDFLNVSKAYYKYKNNPKCTYQLLKDVYNTNNSFILCNPLLEHIKDCACCCNIEKKEVELNPLYMESIKCNKLLEIIYTYGVYKSTEEANVYFPSCINIQNWCSNKKPDPCDSYNEFIDINIQNNFVCFDKKAELQSIKSVKINEFMKSEDSDYDLETTFSESNSVSNSDYDLATNISPLSNNEYKLLNANASFKSKYGLFKNTKPLFI
jgi:hypothetical protein